MAKTKTKKSLIEKTVFNDHAYALAAKKKAEKRVGMIKVGLIISAVSTLATVFGVKFISSNSTVGGLLLFVAIIGAFASYIIGGGVKIALSSAWKLAKFGWFILPFPYDIITGILGFILGVICGMKPGSIFDRIVKVFCLAMKSAPTFWLGLLVLGRYPLL